MKKIKAVAGPEMDKAVAKFVIGYPLGDECSEEWVTRSTNKMGETESYACQACGWWRAYNDERVALAACMAALRSVGVKVEERRG